MSDEQIEIVRRAFDALNRGDVDAALGQTHEDVVFDLTASNAPYAGNYTATDEARAGFQEFLETWEHVQWTVEEVFEAGPDQVIAVTVVHGRVRAGVDGSARGAWLWKFRGNRAERLTLYQTREEAVVAASLG